MASGRSRLSGVLGSADVLSTIGAVRSLGAGVEVDPQADGSLSVIVDGWDDRGPVSPRGPVDCGNSGTTARLLLGVLAGWPCEVTLTGDASLSCRPMRRVTGPLARMGATFLLAEGDTLPVTVHGAALQGADHMLPVASAQVKTALLLAGLRAHGTTRVCEPAASRDHTERMLPAFGVPVACDAASLCVSVDGPAGMHTCDLDVPGDPSSAAFLIAAAVLVDGSDVNLPDVATNATRTGFLRVLRRMGAHIDLIPDPSEAREVGSLRAFGGVPLIATTVRAAQVPSLVDEVPMLALVATAATGTTRFEGIGELRVKESDRLGALADSLTALGACVRSGPDWLEVDGPCQLHGATLDSLGDHRLAMTYALAGLIASDAISIRRFEAIDVSFPGFLQALIALGAC